MSHLTYAICDVTTDLPNIDFSQIGADDQFTYVLISSGNVEKKNIYLARMRKKLAGLEILHTLTTNRSH